ncbi:STAS domain-containing protein [Actinomadura keratinilytica]|uniref:STAS domain-containing protein n=1 Tax=Actinomadura keratinilytica TaxID=547461 RepID=UPI0031E5DB98
MMTDDCRPTRRARLGRRRPEMRCRAGAVRRPPGAAPGLRVAVADVCADAAVVTVEGEIDLGTAETLRGELFALHAAGRRGLVLDFAGVRFCDASGLGALVAAHNRVAADGGRVRLARVRPQQARLLRVTGLDRLFPTHDDLAEAVAAARASTASAG